MQTWPGLTCPAHQASSILPVPDCIGLQVDRDMLPAEDWSQQINPPYVPPRSKLEREVQLLWQTVLNQRSMISVEADFTQQGGGMMHAVVVNGIIRSESGR